VPVVAMHDLGPPCAIQPFGQHRRHPTQQREAPMAVGMRTAFRIDVRIRAVHVHRRVDQVARAALGERAAQQADAVRQGEGRGQRLGIGNAGPQRREGRHQHAHVAALRLERARQRGADVRQAAGLEQREEFGADLQGLHSAASISRFTSTTPCSVR